MVVAAEEEEKVVGCRRIEVVTRLVSMEVAAEIVKIWTTMIDSHLEKSHGTSRYVGCSAGRYRLFTVLK